MLHTVTIKHSENKRTFEIWVDCYLLVQRPKLEEAMNIAMNIVESHGYELHLDV